MRWTKWTNFCHPFVLLTLVTGIFPGLIAALCSDRVKGYWKEVFDGHSITYEKVSTNPMHRRVSNAGLSALSPLLRAFTSKLNENRNYSSYVRMIKSIEFFADKEEICESAYASEMLVHFLAKKEIPAVKNGEIPSISTTENVSKFHEFCGLSVMAAKVEEGAGEDNESDNVVDLEEASPRLTQRSAPDPVIAQKPLDSPLHTSPLDEQANPGPVQNSLFRNDLKEAFQRRLKETVANEYLADEIENIEINENTKEIKIHSLLKPPLSILASYLKNQGISATYEVEQRIVIIQPKHFEHFLAFCNKKNQPPV